MKAKSRFITIFSAAFLLLAVSAVPVSAQIAVRQTRATRSSITLSWPATSGAAGYYLAYYRADASGNKVGSMVEKDLGNRRSYTMTGLSAGKYYGYAIAAYSSAYNKLDSSGSTDKYAATAPGKLKKVTPKGWGNGKTGYFELKSYPDSLRGFQWKLLNRRGTKVIKKGTSTNTVFSAAVKTNQVYKLKVRGYSLIDGKKFYGPWYTKTVVPQPKLKVPTYVSGNRMRVGWSKVAGATKYIVYGSTSSNSGYKKIATVGRNTRSYVVSKVRGSRLQKYKTYYFKVVAVCGKVRSVNVNNSHGYIYTSYR